jgi:ribonuclease VapC
VNLSEVAGKLTDAGMTTGDVRELLVSLGLVVVDFDEAAAHSAAQLRQLGGAQGLSLGDRACLALARSRGLTAYTMDRFWERPAGEAGIELRIIRR